MCCKSKVGFLLLYLFLRKITVIGGGYGSLLDCTFLFSVLNVSRWEFSTFITDLQYETQTPTTHIWSGLERKSDGTFVLMPEDEPVLTGTVDGWSVVDGFPNMGVGDCGAIKLNSSLKIIYMVPCVASNADPLCYRKMTTYPMSGYYDCLPRWAEPVYNYTQTFAWSSLCFGTCYTSSQCYAASLRGSTCTIYKTSSSNIVQALSRPEESCTCLPSDTHKTKIRVFYKYKLTSTDYEVNYCDLSRAVLKLTKDTNSTSNTVSSSTSTLPAWSSDSGSSATANDIRSSSVIYSPTPATLDTTSVYVGVATDISNVISSGVESTAESSFYSPYVGVDSYMSDVVSTSTGSITASITELSDFSETHNETTQILSKDSTQNYITIWTSETVMGHKLSSMETKTMYISDTNYVITVSTDLQQISSTPIIVNTPISSSVASYHILITPSSTTPTFCSTKTVKVKNCKCDRQTNFTEEEKTVFITKILNNITLITRTNSTKYLLSKISVADNRPSATGIGIAGGLMIGIIFSAIVLSDAIVLITYIVNAINK